MHPRMTRPRSIVAATVLSAAVALGAAAQASAASATFTAQLSGANEVPAVDTAARGVATFQLSYDGSELTYRLNVANIENVHMAHIHLAPVGVNGGVVAWLYPDAPPPVPIEGRSQGTLATGTITSADLVGPLAGMTLADLVAAMETGGAYVNVHTEQNPGGEIRGQIH